MDFRVAGTVLTVAVVPMAAIPDGSDENGS
jgi:hypothetical protein